MDNPAGNKLTFRLKKLNYKKLSIFLLVSIFLVSLGIGIGYYVAKKQDLPAEDRFIPLQYDGGRTYVPSIDYDTVTDDLLIPGEATFYVEGYARKMYADKYKTTVNLDYFRMRNFTQYGNSDARIVTLELDPKAQILMDSRRDKYGPHQPVPMYNTDIWEISPDTLKNIIDAEGDDPGVHFYLTIFNGKITYMEERYYSD